MKNIKNKIKTVIDDTWTLTELKGFTHICCECSLSHKVNIKIENGKLYTKWKRLKIRYEKEI